MGYRYENATERESDVSFRVVEIFVSGSNRDKGRNNRFLLVDNRQETLAMVQKEMQDFVKTAILANRLGTLEQRKDWCRNY
jgi:hypothetical protein